MDRVLEHCKRFAFEHWSDFISDRSGCRRFSVELLSELSASNAKGDIRAPTPRTEPADPILEHYRDVMSIEPDLAVVPSGSGAEPVLCHRAVLAVHSEAMRNLLAAQSVLSPGGSAAGNSRRKTATKLPEISLSSEGDHGEVFVKSTDAALALVRFIYYGDTKFHTLVAVELLHALADFRLSALEAAIEHNITHGIDETTAFPVLGCTFHPLWVTRPEMGPLRNAATDYIVHHFGSIDLNTLRGLPPEVFHALQALQRANNPLRGSAAAPALAMARPAVPSSSVEANAVAVARPGVESVVARLAADAAAPDTASALTTMEVPIAEAPALPPKPLQFVADDDEEEEGASD